ncbi:MAG TPA: helix-turn-helix domain-containing protein [Haliangiales bacterium]|nr:helix-turn-helix domain-containing protein [Haliangiales bacterium]
MPQARARRPRRGAPEDTRARLIEAALKTFNDVGYHGTDSNRLARAAGYAPGTFYRHFPDKKAIFLAAYAARVDREWTQIDERIQRAATDAALARAVVGFVVAHHKKWRGLRAGLRSLAVVDRDARAFLAAQRRAQLGRIEAVRRARGLPPRATEDHALLLLVLERVADAIAEGEFADLGLSERAAVRALERFLMGELR